MISKRLNSLAGVAAFLLIPFSPLFCAQTPLDGHIILIDPGHGVLNYEGQVINPGKINNHGQMEHRLNMDIGEDVGALLENEGAHVFFTRTPFDYWRESYGTIEDNKNRTQFAKEVGAEVYVAIHCDWNPSRRFRGITTYYEKSESHRLGELVHRSLIRELKVHDRKLICDTYTVLDVAAMPAILIECGFLSNRAETKKLGTKAYQKKIAKAVVDGLKTYFKEINSKKKPKP